MHDICIYIYIYNITGKNYFAFIAASSPNNFNEDTIEFSLVLELHTYFQF